MNPIYAMDTYFYTTFGAHRWEARCEMLHQLGYDATYLTLWSEDAWNDLPKIANTRQDFGIEVAGVYWTLDLDDRGGANNRFLEALKTVPNNTRFELAIVGQGKFDVNDERLKMWLEAILKACEARDVKISLYPHLGFWLDRVENATQIARKYLQPRLGVVFCGYHWFAMENQDVKKLPQLLKDAAPLLHAANLCGSTCKQEKPRQCTIETLDKGTLDNFAIASMLREHNFKGPIGFQGYGIGGDVYQNLRLSLNAWRDISARLDKYPQWAQMQ